MDEMSIREVGGVGTNDRLPVFLIEKESVVYLDLGAYTKASLSPGNAHRLARFLHRLATRIEKRIDATIAPAAGG